MKHFMVTLWLLGLGLGLGVQHAMAAAEEEYMEQEAPDIVATISMEGGASLSAPLSPGRIRIRTDLGPLVYNLNEIHAVSYTPPPSEDQTNAPALPADLCRLQTIYGDDWVGRCPFQQFQRLADASMREVLQQGFIQRITIQAPPPAPDPTEAPPPPAPEWDVLLTNGSHFRMNSADLTVPLETEAGIHAIPFSLISRIERDTTAELLVVRLIDAPYALQGFPPRRPLRATDASATRTLSIPWRSIAKILPLQRKRASAARLMHDIRLTYAPADVAASLTDPLPLPAETQAMLPVAMLTLETPLGPLVIPTTRLLRILRNPNGSHTFFTTAGDILTGTLKSSRLTAWPDMTQMDQQLPVASAQSVEFTDNKPLPKLPPDALSWRLTTGDILVAAWQRDPAEDSALPQPAAAPGSRRISAMPSASAAATTAALPQPLPNGTWPLKRYTLLPHCTALPFSLPSARIETVRARPPADLPPARIPSTPSATHTDTIFLPAAAFRMGRASGGEGPLDELPSVEIGLAPYFLSSTPVTLAQFRAFVEDEGYTTFSERIPAAPTWRSPGFEQTDDDPVVCVSWRDAAQYCNWLSRRARLTPAYTFRESGRRVQFDPDANGYRLPLEAEWEYAARQAGETIRYPWGNDDDESTASAYANFTPTTLAMDPWPTTNPVKAFPPTPPGFYGLAGNIWEWCQDIYSPTAYATAYRTGAIDALWNPAPGDLPPQLRRVMRGGSYLNTLDFLRCTARGNGVEQLGAPRVGFRVARNAP